VRSHEVRDRVSNKNDNKYLKKKRSESSVNNDIKAKDLKTHAVFLSVLAINQRRVLSDAAQTVRLVEMRLCQKNRLEHEVYQRIPEWVGGVGTEV